jgi:Zn-dependent protease
MFIVLITSPQSVPLLCCLFLIVTLHECGHIQAARRFNIETGDITLFPIGGVASVDVPPLPKEEFWIAICGPLVNVALAPLLYGLATVTDFSICWSLFYINTGIFIFNMIPAFPMDGGRVLRSVLMRFLNDPIKSTVIAGRVSQVICAGLVICAFMGGMFNLGLIAILIGLAAEMEIRRIKMPVQRDFAWRYTTPSGRATGHLSVSGSNEQAVRESAKILADVQQELENMQAKIERIRRGDN